ADELSPAPVVAARPGLRVRRPGTGPGRVQRCRARGLSVLQLRRRDAGSVGADDRELPWGLGVGSWRLGVKMSAVPFPYEEFDVSGVHTYPLASRQSKARVEDFARPYAKGSGVAAWIDGLPNILAGADFKAVVSRIQRARREDGGIIWGVGAHVIKTGLSPVLVDLMRRGYVSALATNGAGLIHDF